MFRTSMTLDATNRAMTVGVGALVLGIAVAAVVCRPGALQAIVAVLVSAPLAIAWALSPTELVVDRGELRVVRRAGSPVVVPLASVADTAPADRIGTGIRIFGVGGFFGSYGVFWSGTLGRFHAYVTRRGPALIVRRNGGLPPIVLTPDDVGGAIAAIDRGLRTGPSRAVQEPPSTH